MLSASLVLSAALCFGPPAGDSDDGQTPAISPTQPQPGEPAIAPAQIESERAVDEPEPTPAEPTPAEPPTQPPTQPGELPSWQEGPQPQPQPQAPAQATPGDPTLPDWTTPAAPVAPKPPLAGKGLLAAAGGTFGAMVLSQLITGTACEQDVYCGSRGWPFRFFGLVTTGLAGGGGWMYGNRIAYDRAQAGKPAKNPIGRRAAGWSMFILGVGGLVADTALYQLCYDRARGPYIDVDGFRYTCSPVISVLTLDLSTLLSATGLGLALSAESQLRNRPKFNLSLSPWGGRGQAGLSVGGRF